MSEHGARVVPTGMCVMCGKLGSVRMTLDQHNRYQIWLAAKGSANPGTHIQDLLYDLDVGQREQLMNGTHSDCFDDLFPPEED